MAGAVWRDWAQTGLASLRKLKTVKLYPFFSYRISFANKSREGGTSSTFNKQMSCFDHY